MDVDPTVRPARPADAEAMARAHARSWRATYTGLLPDVVIDDVVASEVARAERWRAWLADPGRPGDAFVAELGGRVVGFVFWGRSEEPGARLAPADGDLGDEHAAAGEVQAIYLDPEAFGRGVGRALLAAASDAIRAQGLDRAVLWVLASNRRARRFYEAAGWHADGRTKTDERPGGVLYEVRYSRSFDDAPA
jgi:ribosomal protein S18 acetylase RimI-like enzyme